ncbi:MAG: FAD-dependent oxidoreductase [Clostridia bacterium]|nr:FAD-dependent oxidoreductase [Clostridia bacterium]
MNKDFYNGLTGEIITPSDVLYNEARQVWNGAIQKFPKVIVYCYNKNDVKNAILWAKDKNIGVRIRTGGHNYEGYCIGNNVLVIDISRMNKLELDSQNNKLKIEGGVLNEQVYELLGSQGYPFPGGSCPTVGVVGYTLGGGYGYSSRYLGLGCDSLLELEIIDYKGDTVIANAEENSELYWAVRGSGGGNFGVVVSMIFKLPEKVEKVSLVEFYCVNATEEQMRQFIGIWQTCLVNLDCRITLTSSIYKSIEEGQVISGRGIFYGTPDEAQQIVQVFEQITGLTVSIKYLTFLDAIERIEETVPKSQKFKSTGRFVYKEYDTQEIENIVDLIKDTAEGSIFAGITFYAMGGKIEEIGEQDTAFFYRKAKYIFGIQSVWEDPKYAKENINWVDTRFVYIEKITDGSYVNFPYSGLECYDFDYYGENAEILRVINNIYDPNNFFSFPQSVN